MPEQHRPDTLIPVSSSEGESPTSVYDAWMAAAAGRPAWECWGKAYPSAECPAHPLLCHLLDVAAVAHQLLTTHAAPAVRRRLLGLVPNNQDGSLNMLLFVVALHDLGKYTPPFQAKLDWARAKLLARGFDPVNPRPPGRTLS